MEGIPARRALEIAVRDGSITVNTQRRSVEDRMTRPCRRAVLLWLLPLLFLPPQSRSLRQRRPLVPLPRRPLHQHLLLLSLSRSGLVISQCSSLRRRPSRKPKRSLPVSPSATAKRWPVRSPKSFGPR